METVLISENKKYKFLFSSRSTRLKETSLQASKQRYFETLPTHSLARFLRGVRWRANSLAKNLVLKVGIGFSANKYFTWASLKLDEPACIDVNVPHCWGQAFLTPGCNSSGACEILLGVSKENPSHQSPIKHPKFCLKLCFCSVTRFSATDRILAEGPQPYYGQWLIMADVS